MVSDTRSESDAERRLSSYWDAAVVSAWIVGTIISLRNIPSVIEGVPFIQVIPALLLGGMVALGVDILRVVVAPKRYERAFVEIAAIILLVGVVRSLVKLRDEVWRGCR